MMAITLHEGVVDGLATLEVKSHGLYLQIVPAVGGKIIRLQDRTTQRDFLWRYPDRSIKPVPYGASFEQYDISGWDECFPTIGEVVYPLEPWKGIVVPDHGELWTLPWQWDFAGDVLRMWCHSVRFGYHFERTFTFRDAPAGGGGTIGIHYRVNNPTPYPLHALWSMHPFFRVSPASRVLLPPDVRMRIEISSQERVGHFLAEIPWPLTTDHSSNQMIDLAVMGAPQPTTEKLFSTPLPEGWAALYHPDDNAFVAFTFDPKQIPFMGVCQIRGGWPAQGTPTYSILLEPCTGWPDRLDLALSRGAGMVVPGNGALEWEVALHVGNGRQALEQIIARPLDYLLG
jgi:hypothetical protein